MDSKMDSENNVYKYVCEKCNFKTCNKYNYSKHNLSLKHKKQEMDSEKCEKMYYCNCGKKYKYDTGLYKHKKKCQGEKVYSCFPLLYYLFLVFDLFLLLLISFSSKLLFYQ